jgi:hypothetical protein
MAALREEVRPATAARAAISDATEPGSLAVPLPERADNKQEAALAPDLPEHRPEGLSPAGLQSAFPAPRLGKEKRLWEAAARSRSKDALMAYLRAYPQGAYAPLARERLASLKAGPAEPKARAPAKPPKHDTGTVATADQNPQPPQPKPPAPRTPPGVRWPSSDEPFVDPMPGAH